MNHGTGLALVTPLLFLLIGCGATHLVPVENDAALNELNDAIHDSRVTINLKGQGRVSGISVRVTPDSTSRINGHVGAFNTVPTEMVEAVTIRRHLQGAAIGAGIGAAVGIVVARTEGSEFFPQSFFIVPITAIGGLLGSFFGNPTRYELR